MNEKGKQQILEEEEMVNKHEKKKLGVRGLDKEEITLVCGNVKGIGAVSIHYQTTKIDGSALLP